MVIEWGVIGANLIYASCGVILALFAMIVGYKIFDLITPFKTGQELDDNNVAIGIVVGCMFIGVGLAVGMVVGFSLI